MQSVLNSRSTFFSFESDVVSTLLSLPSDSFVVRNGNEAIDDLEHFVSSHPNGSFSVSFRLRGGKGGFGTLLRSFRINKSTNQLMCRDLNGRRLADVEEEKKLKKWVETSADREKEKEEKKKAKYEKLRAATQEKPKHDFSDTQYIETREKILEETDDAFEAGFDFLKKKRKQDSPTVEEEEEESGDEDIASTSTFKPKRRRVAVEESGSSSDSKEEEEKEEEKTVEESIEEKIEEVKEAEVAIEVKKEEEKTVEEVKAEPKVEKKKYEKPTDIPTDFPPVDIEAITDVKQLESLGLFHLKHALETRGLKCGGSLEERAARLFSVKGMSPDQYPKAIRAPKKK